MFNNDTGFHHIKDHKRCKGGKEVFGFHQHAKLCYSGKIMYIYIY